MRQLLYISSSKPRGSKADVSAILEQSQRNNARDGVTGLLWTDGTRFLQVLEGESADVGRVFKRIGSDARHQAIVVLHDRDVEARQFGDWAMARRRAQDTDMIFDERMRQALAGASEDVRGTFVGLIAARSPG